LIYIVLVKNLQGNPPHGGLEETRKYFRVSISPAGEGANAAFHQSKCTEKVKIWGWVLYIWRVRVLGEVCEEWEVASSTIHVIKD